MCIRDRDEPTVGLHPRDTSRLISAMNRLKKRGNTLVVVEHEETVMRAADSLVAVSYTHLDVYKRQDLEVAMPLSRR